MVVRDDGTVFAYDPEGLPRSQVEDWTDIVAVAAGYDHSLGLKSDGTVVAAEVNEDGECDVEDWEGIKQIAIDVSVSFGLTKEGEVLLAGFIDVFDRKKVQAWSDVQLLNINADSFGITSNGEVLCTNDFYTTHLPSVLPLVKDVVCDGNSAYFITRDGDIWEASELESFVRLYDRSQNIVQITMDGGYLVTLDENGKTKSSGSLRKQSEWENIVSISDCIGITTDGRLLSSEPLFDVKAIHDLRINVE